MGQEQGALTSGGAATLVLRGAFVVRAADGRDITPVNRKSRALLALLATEPERRRARAWLLGMLWSEKPQDKAQASLRTALKELIQGFAPIQILGRNRLDVWLTDAVRIDRGPVGGAPLLEGVDAPDPAFENWLRDLRLADEVVAAPRPVFLAPPRPTGGTIVILRGPPVSRDQDTRFLEAMLSDTLSARMEAEGADEIYADVEPEPERLERAAAVIHLEYTSTVDASWWNVQLRALAGPERRFLWSGRMRVPMCIRRLAEGPEIHGFASRALAQIMNRLSVTRMSERSPLVAVGTAAARLHSGDPARVMRAEAALRDVSGSEAAAVAMAWLAFSGLVRALEFGEDGPDLRAESMELAAKAVAAQPGNPLVTALAARVAFDLGGDLDLAAHHARAAVQADDQNPYALHAASRIALMSNQVEAANAAAVRARAAAEGLPHAFVWDMEVCLTALGIGALDQARGAARAAHLGNPTWRAALRYLVALDLIEGDAEAATRSVARLRGIEPGFAPSQLRDPSYPVLTLRRTGYDDLLPR